MSLESERAARDQRPSAQHAGVIQEVAGRHVIRTVQDDAVLLHQGQRVTAVQRQVVGHDGDVVVQTARRGAVSSEEGYTSLFCAHLVHSTNTKIMCS